MKIEKGSKVRIKKGTYIWLTATVIHVYDGENYVVEPDDPYIGIKVLKKTELELLE